MSATTSVNPGMGGGAPLVGGVALLPATGDNTALLVVSLLSTGIGLMILSSSLISFAAKKLYRA